MKTGIHIGHDQETAKAINEVGELILKIMNTSCADSVKLKALDCLQYSSSINGISFNGVSVINRPIEWGDTVDADEEVGVDADDEDE